MSRQWWIAFFVALLMSGLGLWGCLHLFMAWVMWDLPVPPPRWYNPFYWLCVVGAALLAAPIYALRTSAKTWSRLAAFALAPSIYVVWYLLWPVAMGSPR